MSVLEAPDLPSGWARTALENLGAHALGKMLDRSKNKSGIPYPYLRNINVRWDSFDLADVFEMNFEQDEIERYSLQSGDLMICEGGEPGRCAIWDGHIPEMKYQKALHRVQMLGGIDPKIVAFQLKLDAMTGRLTEHFTGTTIKHFTGKALAQYTVRVPPLNEQRRIVAKIEALQEKSRRARYALDAILPLLDKFRQSVLAAAFRGDLTADWRARNPDVEPASVLLERIRAERRRRWEEAELAKMRARGNLPKNDKLKGKYKIPVMPDPAKLSSLPGAWRWATIDALTDLVTSGSRGWGKHYSTTGPLFIRIGNLQRENIALDLGEVAHVNPPPGSEGLRTLIHQGDILLSITADVGMVALAPPNLGEAYINQHIALLRPSPLVNSRFLTYALLDPNGFQGATKEAQYGMTKAGLNLIQIRACAVPIPPLLEQIEIVARIDELLERLRSLSMMVLESEKRLTELFGAILAGAFRGKLVPQDPNDEPASKLLERIRSEQRTQRKSLLENT